MSSIREDMPNVLLEAIGVPALVSNRDGVTGYVTLDQVNSIVPDSDDSVGGVVKQLFDDREFVQNIGLESSKFIGDNFSLESVAKKISEKYWAFSKQSKLTTEFDIPYE